MGKMEEENHRPKGHIESSSAEKVLLWVPRGQMLWPARVNQASTQLRRCKLNQKLYQGQNATETREPTPKTRTTMDQFVSQGVQPYGQELLIERGKQLQEPR